MKEKKSDCEGDPPPRAYIFTPPLETVYHAHFVPSHYWGVSVSIDFKSEYYNN